MRKKIMGAVPIIFLLLTIGFVGGMETAENIVAPAACALVCLAAAAGGLRYSGLFENYIEEDEDK